MIELLKRVGILFGFYVSGLVVHYIITLDIPEWVTWIPGALVGIIIVIVATKEVQ